MWIKPLQKHKIPIFREATIRKLKLPLSVICRVQRLFWKCWCPGFLHMISKSEAFKHGNTKAGQKCSLAFTKIPIHTSFIALKKLYETPTVCTDVRDTSWQQCLFHRFLSHSSQREINSNQYKPFFFAPC